MSINEEAASKNKSEEDQSVEQLKVEKKEKKNIFIV